MTNLYQQNYDALYKIGCDLQANGTLPSNFMDLWREKSIVVEPPRDKNHGQLSTNLALLLSKAIGMKPRDLADIFVNAMQNAADIGWVFYDISIAGPGFINWKLHPTIWQKTIHTILNQGDRYGNSSYGGGRKVNIEYVSANPTGPLHVGHSRGAIVGDALSALLIKAGFDVTKEYYVNDAGVQIDKLADSAYIRYLEALGQPAQLTDQHYPGEYLIPVGLQLKADFGDSLTDLSLEAQRTKIRPIVVAAMMDLIKQDLAMLGIHHGVFSSELALVERGKVEAMMDHLKAQNLLYHGVLEPPKGQAPPDDWEQRTQLLFKASQFGDDGDRPLQKSDGSWTYFASDIAYHYDKYLRGHLLQINVLGADHGGYVKRIQAAVKAVSDGKASLSAKLCQLVRFTEDGKPVRMSKRAGNFVTVKDLIDDVGKDVVRFFMLTRKNDAPLDFDLSLVKAQSKDNPVFYVQYAHARCASVLRQAQAQFPDVSFADSDLDGLDYASLDGPEIIDLLQILAQWPRVIEFAAESQEPHRIPYYLQMLAASFHGLWTQGKSNYQLRFIDENDTDASLLRIGLVRAVQSVLANGLHLLAVDPLESL
ncbi:MAG: arginine--tRNA ligase [Alphaproteobacteria bacterium]